MGLTFRQDKSTRENDYTCTVAVDATSQEELSSGQAIRDLLANACMQLGMPGAGESGPTNPVPLNKETDEPFTDKELQAPGAAAKSGGFRGYFRMQRRG